MVQMKKNSVLLRWLMLLFVAGIPCIPGMASDVQTYAPVRVINVVYDDSGSMITSGDNPVDTWCQAKYAMEVFAAMLGEKDSMNIYYMSDFDNGNTNADPKISLKGRDSQKENVLKIHNTVSAAGSTPFDAVRKAYSDLAAANADEKWLVVLTDGEFQGIENIDSFFAKKQKDVNVMFLGMGPDADAVSADEGQGVYFAKAETSKEILKKITDICTRIFNSDSLDVNISEKTISFDVPMSELVVFAQGADVSINRIVDAAGKEYLCSEKPVTVQYSEAAATNHEKFIVDRNLKGSITTFKDDFAAGDYKLDISGADTIEVYYKPDIEAYVYLTDDKGNEAGSAESLKAGEYTVEFGFVKAGTSEKVAQSPLLGEVSYTAKVTNNGVEDKDTCSSGDKLYFEEGTLEIDVTAHYLKYNSFSTHLTYSVYADKQMQLSVIQNPEYEITRDGIKADEPIQIKVLCEESEITDEQWDEMGLLSVAVNEPDGQQDYGDFVVEKSETAGIYNLYPSLSGKDMDSAVYQDCDFKALYENQHGESAWYGEASGTIAVKDTRTVLERYSQKLLQYLPWLLGAVVLVIVFIGETKPFKKRLPKNLAKKPTITRDPVKVGVLVPRRSANGIYEKTRFSPYIPFRAERGWIEIVPSEVHGIPVMKVKAVGKNMMEIENWEEYVGKDHILFNWKTMTEDKFRRIISPGTCIKVEKGDFRYSCTLNK